MTATYAVLELNVDRRLNDELEVSALYIDTQDVERRAGPVPLVLDLDELRDAAVSPDRDAYGRILAAAVFGDERLRELFQRARHETAAAQQLFRIRLVIGDRALDLHSVDWERLGDPEDGTPLFRGGPLLFSRFLNSLDWRRAPSTPPRSPKALVVVANPSDLDSYGTADLGSPDSIDVDAELERVRDVLSTWRREEIAAPDRATLDAVAEGLARHPDVLYLVCHGLASGEKAVLLLENDAGAADAVTATELVDRIARLGRTPRLIVLASCQSAGAAADLDPSDDPGSAVRWRLGPELCRAGVPAVLAMQGNLTQQSAAAFLRVFFQGADQHGQLDRAMADAREKVGDRPDWSVPTLFMRLRSGRLWARAQADQRYGEWPALIRAIKDRRCVPILGAGASELVLGAQRDIAQALATNHQFPLAPYQADDLPQVANYVQVRQGRAVFRGDVRELFCESLRERYSHIIDDVDPENLDTALAAVATYLADNNVTEPHEVVARLPFRLYITTEPTDLLSQAIEHAGRTPVRGYFRWREQSPVDVNEMIEWPVDPLIADPGFEPVDDQHPIVYHLFGHVGIDWSVALTEDDYFEFLIGVDSSRESRSPLHPYVTRCMTQQTLLFLGFGMEDWDFRVLLRTLARLPGKRKLDVSHLAVQLDPDEDRTVAPDRAREYLEKFFGRADMSIYWGSAETFVSELHREAQALRLPSP